jgi:tripeptidyl-peptidase-1
MVARFALAAVLSVAAFAVAEPVLSPHVVHERRSALPSGWARAGRADPTSVLTFRFGLAQNNLDKLEEFLNEVAHPDSPLYGAHWSADRIANTFAPSQGTIETVRSWLTGSGVHSDRVRQTSGKVWLEVNATVAEAEKLLATEYNVYKHETGSSRIGE